METTQPSEEQIKATQEAIVLAEVLEAESTSGMTRRKYPLDDRMKKIMATYNTWYAEIIPGTTMKRTMSLGCAPCGPKTVTFFLNLKAIQHG